MNGQVRKEETLGSLDQRILNLENSSKWELPVGKIPLAALGIVLMAIISAAWLFYTWNIERLDKRHQIELTNLQNQNKERISLLKYMYKTSTTSAKEKCSFEKDKVNLPPAKPEAYWMTP